MYPAGLFLCQFRSSELVEFFDPNVFPGNRIRTGPLLDAVYLQADEACGMRLIDRFVRQIFDLLTIDPGLDPRTFGNDPKLVPLAIFHVFMWLQTILGS